jgi:hypothetical protein
MSNDIDHDRRRFLGSAAMTIAAVQLGAFGAAEARVTTMNQLKQIDAGRLNVGYAEAGPAFDRSAASFDNPDHVSITIHNYRWRLGQAFAQAVIDVDRY